MISNEQPDADFSPIHGEDAATAECRAAGFLRRHGVANAAREAAWLREGLPWPANNAGCWPAAVAAAYAGRVHRRGGGEPLQYILGTVEFRGLTIEVGPGVLIPRPETEVLVEIALSLHPGLQGPVCDLCTGSGAVALALAAALPGRPDIVASDISAAALDYARRNRERLRLPQVTLRQSDLFAEFAAAERFAMITANPPYIAVAEFAALPKDVRDFEPEQALLGGGDGLELLRRIAAAAPPRLLPGGWLVCECDSGQIAAVTALFGAAGLEKIAVFPDCYGRPRAVAGRRLAQ